MWAIRFLNGKLRGKVIALQEGEYLVGRSQECQIVVSEDGVSKKHLRIDVLEDGVVIEDLNSSNGSFVNGVKVQESDVYLEDKVSLYQTTFDLIKVKNQEALSSSQNASSWVSGVPSVASSAGMASPPMGGGADGASVDGVGEAGVGEALNPSVDGSVAMPSGGDSGGGSEIQGEVLKLTLKNWFKNYLDKVVLPGVYKLPVWIELKWVIGGLLVFFVVTMTALSAIPLIRILKASVEQESMNHAESIAVTLAQRNIDSIKSKIHSSASVDYALRRPGVKEAFIINALDGRILAPSDKAHTYSKIPFIHEARKKETISVKKLDNNMVIAMVPIQFFNSKTNSYQAEAYSAVIYSMGALAYGNKRVVSLLVQTCFIALVLGSLLFFFLYKMIEYPVVHLNRQLNSALKDDTLDVQTDYQFSPLQELTSNINSALSRISAAQEMSQSIGEYDRQMEMTHIIEMIGYPTLGINFTTRKIDACSAHFEEETGVSSERIMNCAIEEIDDQALKLNITGLLEKVEQHPHEIATDSLEFAGVEFQLSAKGIYGKESLSYVVISFIPTADQQEEVG